MRRWVVEVALGIIVAGVWISSGCTTIRSVPIDTPPDVLGRARELRTRLPPSLEVAAAPPFVVVSDLPDVELDLVVTEVILRAGRRLETEFFTAVPRRPVTIWLLNGSASYQSHANAYLHQTPHSPYGYYAPRKHAVVIDYTLGTGTIVHEMVHVYVRANFPAAPSWFDEGLASLYEQCSFEGDGIRGEVNWRLPVLQLALEMGDAPRLSSVMETSRREFYEKTNQSVHYATARYLCFYLQEKGLLERYYEEFFIHHRQDPSGITSLETVLGETVSEFESRWRNFVMGLHYRVGE